MGFRRPPSASRPRQDHVDHEHRRPSSQPGRVAGDRHRSQPVRLPGGGALRGAGSDRRRRPGDLGIAAVATGSPAPPDRALFRVSFRSLGRRAAQRVRRGHPAWVHPLERPQLPSKRRSFVAGPSVRHRRDAGRGYTARLRVGRPGDQPQPVARHPQRRDPPGLSGTTGPRYRRLRPGQRPIGPAHVHPVGRGA